VRELERDFTFSLTKYPSLIFVFLVVRAEKEKQFLNLYQGNMFVAEYASKFEKLSKYFRDQTGKEYLCERFENGLEYEIRDIVEPMEILQYQVLLEK